MRTDREKTIDVRQQEKLVSAEKSTFSEHHHACDDSEHELSWRALKPNFAFAYDAWVSASFVPFPA
jgi:hypothetical protein